MLTYLSKFSKYLSTDPSCLMLNSREKGLLEAEGWNQSRITNLNSFRRALGLWDSKATITASVRFSSAAFCSRNPTPSAGSTHEHPCRPCPAAIPISSIFPVNQSHQLPLPISSIFPVNQSHQALMPIDRIGNRETGNFIEIGRTPTPNCPIEQLRSQREMNTEQWAFYRLTSPTESRTA